MFGPTHHFRRDVGVGQVAVLTHDRKVAVDVDGQRVSGQNHDAAGRAAALAHLSPSA